MFSVVIPLYNKEKSIPLTLQSVLSQTYADFEVLVVNDGSTDNSRQVVAAVDDARIRIIDKVNGGVSSARNTGIAEARFEHIAFIDGDDLWNKDFLTVIASLVKDYPEADVFATGYSCNSAPEVVMYTLGVEQRGIVTDYFTKVYTAPFMHASSVCITKKAFQKAGLFNENISHGEDYNMWDRLGRLCTIAAAPEAMASYRSDTENRAMPILPAPEKLWLYHVDPALITHKAMKNYYSRYVRRAVVRYLTAGKYQWAFRLMRKSPYVSWFDYLLVHEYKNLDFLLKKLNNKKIK